MSGHSLKGTGRTELGYVAICECGEARWGDTSEQAQAMHAVHAKPQHVEPHPIGVVLGCPACEEMS